MEETNVDTLNNCLNHFMDQLENTNETYQFYEYFKQYYFFQKQLWAMCYRQQAGINTNMYVEHFHRILKYIYMKGVTNKRVDKCVHVLLKIARDKAIDQSTKGKSSYRISVMKKRHAASFEMALDLIVPCGYNEWKVISSTDDSHTYQVKKRK